MDVILPQYIVSKSYTPAAGEKYAQLLSSTLGTDPASSIWSSSTAYTTGNKVYYLDTDGVRKGCWCEYEALQDSTDKNPYLETAYWVCLGAVNMYNMFDQYVNTVSKSTTADITIVFYAKSITDIAFVNVQASEIIINAWRDVVPSTSYPYTANCTSDNKFIDGETVVLTQKITDWYEYFFDDFDYTRTLSKSIEGLLYNNVIISITFKKISSLDCYIGAIIPGRKYNIGSLQYGVSTGIIDYSKKVFDENFGSHYIKEGNYRKTMDCDLLINNDNVNTTNSIMTQLRAKPTLWQGNQGDNMEFDNLLVYGIEKNFLIIMNNFSHSECNLEIEGLI